MQLSTQIKYNVISVSNIIKQIPITIETHFLNHLSNKTVFRYTVEDYEKALKKSGYISRYNVTVFSTEKTPKLAIITNHNKVNLNNSEILNKKICNRINKNIFSLNGE